MIVLSSIQIFLLLFLYFFRDTDNFLTPFIVVVCGFKCKIIPLAEASDSKLVILRVFHGDYENRMTEEKFFGSGNLVRRNLVCTEGIQDSWNLSYRSRTVTAVWIILLQAIELWLTVVNC